MVKKAVKDGKTELAYLSKLDTELAAIAEDIGNTDGLGEGIEMASTLCSAFEENPLVAALMGKIEREYGISIASPLELTKMVITGGDHPYFKVASAMIRFPVTGMEIDAKFMLLMGTVVTLSNMVTSIDPSVLDDMGFQDETLGGIPGSVIESLKLARLRLVTPHLDGPYKQAIEDVQEAIDELSNAKLWIGTEVANLEKMALTNALNAASAQANKYWPEIKTGLAKLAEAIDVINTTVIKPAGADKRLGKIRKVRTDIAKEIQKMKDPSVPQGPLMPAYILALASIKRVLEISQPRPSDGNPPPVVTPISSWDSALVASIIETMNRILSFTNRPYNVDAFADYCNQLQSKYNEFAVMYANTLIEVEANWVNFPGVKELLDSVKAMLDGMGFDAAAEALDLGDIEGFADMSELTALSTGSAFVAVQRIAGLFSSLGLFNLTDEMDKLKSSLKKKLDTQTVEKKAKSKNRIANVKKRLDRLNKSFDSTMELVAQVLGAIDAVRGIAEINIV